MSSQPKALVIVGGNLSLMAFLKASNPAKLQKQGVKITVVQANPYLEWSIGSSVFITRPGLYESKFLNADKTSFEYPEVKASGGSYVYSPATGVDPVGKRVTCADGTTLSYDGLILASGYKLPLLHATPGTPLDQRRKEVELWSRNCSRAKTIVVNGPGAIGLEIAGDARIGNPNARIVLLSRTGEVCKGVPEATKQAVLRGLTDMGIELVVGKIEGISVTGDGGFYFGGASAEEARTGTVPVMGPGQITFQNGSGQTSPMAFDVFLPGFYQGANTSFLPANLLENANGSKNVKTNAFLQSEQHPEIFVIGANSTREGWVAPKLEGQIGTVAKNAINLLTSKPLIQHKEAMKGFDLGSRPPTIKIGNGDGSYLIWDNLPGCVPSTCFTVCGFPFCFPLCAAAGCDINGCFMCGFCMGGRPEGRRTAKAFGAVAGLGGVKMFPGNMGGKRYDGFGKSSLGAPGQERM